MVLAILKKGLLAFALISLFLIQEAQADSRNNGSEDIASSEPARRTSMVTFVKEETDNLAEDQKVLQPPMYYNSQERKPSFVSKTRVSYRPAKLHPTPLHPADGKNELSSQEIDDNSDSDQEGSSEDEEILPPISYTKQLYESDIELASYIQ